MRHAKKQIFDIQQQTGAEYLHIIACKFFFGPQIKNRNNAVLEKKVKQRRKVKKQQKT